MGAYLKAWVMVAAAVLAAVGPNILDTGMGFIEWLNVIILGATALQVANAENLPGYRYAKTVAAGVSAGVVVIIAAWSDAFISTSEWIGVVLAVGGAIGVWAVPNAGAVKGVFVGHVRPA